MLGQIFAALGSHIGSFFGNSALTSLGRFAGKSLGNYLDRKWSHKKEYRSSYEIGKENFTFQLTKEGDAIALIFGKAKVQGSLIWVDKIQEIYNTTSTNFISLAKNKTIIKEKQNIEYTLSFAVAICEGEINEISKVFAHDELIDLKNYKFTLYKGKPDQEPDKLMQNKIQGPIPAYRDLAYIVFEDMPLADFDNVIPSFSFEVTRRPNVKNSESVEDMVTSMVMIPGSGEYVYDTIIQKKFILAFDGSIMREEDINSHNQENIANSVYSLNQLQTVCSNVEWVAPVVCWFGNSLDIASCEIQPAVEFKDDKVGYSENWQVASFNRATAYEISKNQKGDPTYGGSINDASVIRYLEELRARKLKIMFYPMFFMDIPNKPWRGHLSGPAEHVSNFFNKENGYNNFILHYANLVKDHVDAFVIGSELIGLTKIRSDTEFPAVEELKKLAHRVKNIVGSKVKVTYAADWSEYHHTEGGWYNLDSLWASSNIDFIGIDAYFPITSSKDSIITDTDLNEGFSSGEGYDYYIDYETGRKKPLAAPYAWKNIKYWWESEHINPDGKKTAWIPKSKKIWFTEFGFPSIDKATNQPNIFFDPLCQDGGVPKESNGEVDFSIQRRAINAFIKYWSKEEYIENMFLWTWDARPYPSWPHMNIWSDGYLWEKGHWVNDKFGTCNLANVIKEISIRVGIEEAIVNCHNTDKVIDGIIMDKNYTGFDIINILRDIYFFEIISYTENGEIIFIKRGLQTPYILDRNNFIKISNNSFLEIYNVAYLQIISKINIFFIDPASYVERFCSYNNDCDSNRKNITLQLPIVMSKSEALQIAKLSLQNAANEDKIISFVLPFDFVYINPSSNLTIIIKDTIYHVRVITTRIEKLMIYCVAVVDDISIYQDSKILHEVKQLKIENTEIKAKIIELPFYLGQDQKQYLMLYVQSSYHLDLFASTTKEQHSWRKLGRIFSKSSIGSVANFDQLATTNIFTIDYTSKLWINGENFEQYNNNNWHIAIVGMEYIRFSSIEKKGENLFLVSNLTRGEFGSEQYMFSHKSDEDFIIIEHGYHLLEIDDKSPNDRLSFLLTNQENNKQMPLGDVYFHNYASQQYSCHILEKYIRNNSLYISWITKTNLIDSWSQKHSHNQGFYITIEALGKNFKYQIESKIKDNILIEYIEINIQKDDIPIDLLSNEHVIIIDPIVV